MRFVEGFRQTPPFGLREMTDKSAELSAVARCCLVLRNNPQLLSLVV